MGPCGSSFCSLWLRQLWENEAYEGRERLCRASVVELSRIQKRYVRNRVSACSTCWTERDGPRDPETPEPKEEGIMRKKFWIRTAPLRLHKPFFQASSAVSIFCSRSSRRSCLWWTVKRIKIGGPQSFLDFSEILRVRHHACSWCVMHSRGSLIKIYKKRKKEDPL